MSIAGNFRFFIKNIKRGMVFILYIFVMISCKKRGTKSAFVSSYFLNISQHCMWSTNNRRLPLRSDKYIGCYSSGKYTHVLGSVKLLTFPSPSEYTTQLLVVQWAKDQKPSGTKQYQWLYIECTRTLLWLNMARGYLNDGNIARIIFTKNIGNYFFILNFSYF